MSKMAFKENPGTLIIAWRLKACSRIPIENGYKKKQKLQKLLKALFYEGKQKEKNLNV